MLYLLFLFGSISLCKCNEKPNIVLIIADDLGWNDVGFHGSNQIPTPNIDALAWSGVALQNYYVTPICTPSRAALMTGKYPIHNGMQHTVIYASEPRGLPLSEKILPQYLKELGYKTHLVGKWHLGSFKKEYLPLNRGFDSHLGFWSGKIDMYDHIIEERGYWGMDFRRDFAVAHDLFGQYATHVYTNEAVKIIKAHNTSEPLFLMVAHSAVHSGNTYEPLRAPEHWLANFTHIDNFQRRKYAAVVSELDKSVGDVVASLQEQGLLENSIIVFTTDNGGPADGFNDNAASNYPLRGVKNTLWEGGVRGAGLLWSPLIKKKSRIAKQKMHLVDWLPTLLSAAGMNISSIQGIDGVDQWCALSQDLESNRLSVVHNIDDIFGSASITVDKWKLLKGTNYNGAWDAWYGPAGRAGVYDTTRVLASAAASALKDLAPLPDTQRIIKLRGTQTRSTKYYADVTEPQSKFFYNNCSESTQIIKLVIHAAPSIRLNSGNEATIKCVHNEVILCQPLEAPCLYNIEEDPCETKNLANIEVATLHHMLDELDKVNKTAVPPNNKPLDPMGDPKYWGQLVTNFGDYKQPSTNSLC